MKWRCMMCGTIVEEETEPRDCTGCKFRNRYKKFEDPDYITVTNRKGETLRIPRIRIDESKIKLVVEPSQILELKIEETDMQTIQEARRRRDDQYLL